MRFAKGDEAHAGLKTKPHLNPVVHLVQKAARAGPGGWWVEGVAGGGGEREGLTLLGKARHGCGDGRGRSGEPGGAHI